MRKLIAMLRSGPVIVGEFRGGKAETAKRFDKTDKNAAPIEFGMFKCTLELLGDGSPIMVSVFLDHGVNAEEFAKAITMKRGDIVAIAVSKVELLKGVRRVSCGATSFFVLEKAEADQLRQINLL
jgi:aspartate aminotransferase-like enzyme